MVNLGELMGALLPLYHPAILPPYRTSVRMLGDVNFALSATNKNCYVCNIPGDPNTWKLSKQVCSVYHT